METNKNPNHSKRQGIFNVSDTPSDNGELMQNNPATATNGVSETNEEISQLANQLIRALEKKYGKPIKITSDSPETEKYGPSQGLAQEKGFSLAREGGFAVLTPSFLSGRQCFGQFEGRGVVVTRVPDLDKKYLDDAALIEGEYSSLTALQLKTNNLNLLYSSPLQGGKTKEAFDLVVRETGKRLLMNNLATNFEECSGRLRRSQAEKIFNDYGYKFFNYNIVARADGVYDDRTSGGLLSMVDETLIARVQMKLL